MAHFEWGDIESEVMAMSGEKIKELREICETLMYLCELVRKYWKLAPEGIEEEEGQRITCIKFKKYGKRVQLDYVDGAYFLNRTKGTHRKPPRARPRPPQEQKIHKPQIKLTTRRTRPAAATAKKPPKKTDKKGDTNKRIVQFWHNLQRRLWAALSFAAVVLSSSWVKLRAMIKLCGATTARALELVRTRSARIASFVQHHLNQLLIHQADFEAHTEAAGLRRFEKIWLGQDLGLDMFILRCADDRVTQSYWDSSPFGKRPEESELVPG
ncbi:MAG TPA: hypothetical protein VM915_08690 [Verrucomicrobiae bacterium]|nr:hypothetical protein [Verrucomicrobiae bacterium]